MRLREDKVLSGLHSRAPRRPSEEALRDVRRRFGRLSRKAAFENVAGPLPQPRASWSPHQFADRMSHVAALQEPGLKSVITGHG